MHSIAPASIARPPVSAARAHVVGLALLALLLQAVSPLLHARLLALHAASTGQRIDVAAFCLSSPAASVPAGKPDGTTLPSGFANCQLCQGGAPPAADVPTPSVVAAPSRLVAMTEIALAVTDVRATAIPAAHRPRGPPVV